MCELGHTLLLCETLVQLKYSVHVRSSVQLIKSGRIQCSVRFILFCEIHSAEHLFKSVRGVYESEIPPHFPLIFVFTLIVEGRRRYINQ